MSFRHKTYMAKSTISEAHEAANGYVNLCEKNAQRRILQVDIAKRPFLAYNSNNIGNIQKRRITMDRIKEGYINVDGYVIGPETTTDELTDLGIDTAVVRVHAHGYLEVLFNKPIVSDGVEFQVSVRILKEDDSKVVLLDPKLKSSMKDILDESRMKQEICEEWLKRNIDVEPTRDTDDGIFYDFPWGHLYSSAAQHINFGNLEGCIIITYGE